MERDYSGSRAAAEEVLKQNPEDVQAGHVVVETYVVQKQRAQAGEKLAKVVAARPNAPLQQLMGQWDLNVGNLAAARKAFEAAKAADPKYLRADLALSEVDVREKRLDAAKQRLTESVKAHPRNIAGLLMLAGLEAESEDRMDAISRYRAVLDIDGSNVAALNGLAYELTYTSPDEALPLAQRAVELAPGDAAVHETLGWVFFRKAIYSSAVTQLKEAVAKQPTPRRQFHLGMAYLKTGEQRLGQMMVQAALQKAPALAGRSRAGNLSCVTLGVATESDASQPKPRLPRGPSEIQNINI
jgi:tetratricopeptide (TPR) repeat protein